MDSLQSTVAYWRDCIKSEGALEQSFGIKNNVFAIKERVRARLFEGEFDPFIFSPGNTDYQLEKGKTSELVLKARSKGQDVYFGYPLLMFYDKTRQQNHVAPLFVLRLEVTPQADGGAMLSRAEALPSLGSAAFTKLGLSQDEIVALNNETKAIFDANKTSKLDTILYLLQKETHLNLIEGIHPEALSPASTIHPYDGTVVYNKAMLYASDATVYNLHVLNDLEKLTKADDLTASSLKYLTGTNKGSYETITPVLPFLYDEYQLRAIQHIIGSDHTVVTGPPGTGKSQFIANLVVNLFLQNKKVLFVSHTGEAVRVVNERINENFANLMMQTGKKDVRQDLGRRLETMVADYNDQQAASAEDVPMTSIELTWKEITKETNYLQRTHSFHKRLERLLLQKGTLDSHTKTIRRLSDYPLQLQIKLINFLLRYRRPSHEVVKNIEKLKVQHVDVSAKYVKANYLKLILGSGLYGELVAYIDAVQHKKFTHGHKAEASEKYIHTALKAMNIWSCTLKSLAATFPLKPNLFDYVIFDEASQIDLPSAAPALYRAKRVVVVGDENQLNHIAHISPTLEEELAKKYQMRDRRLYPALVRYTDTSLFSSTKRALKEPEQELKNHYRSNALIANLFSGVFYGGKLKIREPEMNFPSDIAPGVYWVDVEGTALKHKAGSKYNQREVSYIVKLLERLLPVANEQNLTIGITTPYARQRDIIAQELAKKFTAEELRNVRTLTVHKFQGSEVDILLFSVVVAKNGDGGSDLWYVKNKQILNVAISRAKQLLLIVGDNKFAQKSGSKLKEIAEYCNHVSEGGHKIVPNRPMNIFEKKLLLLLKDIVPENFELEPQYVVDGRFTVDFALIHETKRIAIELDGKQHEIIGGLPVFEDARRDTYLEKTGWAILRIPVHELLSEPQKVRLNIEQLCSATFSSTLS